jgi:carbamoyltransferase
MGGTARRSNAVLGLNLSHDRSACLVIDGQVRFAIAEERLSRLKHDIPLNHRRERFCLCPLKAIKYCLEAASVDLSDIDLVVASTTYVLDATTGRRRALHVGDVTSQCERLSADRVRITGHHFAHAISAGWCSGFADAAVVTVDGGGSITGYDADGQPTDFERSTMYSMKDLRLKRVARSTGGPPAYGNSVGDLYQVITTYLGFGRGEEGKTMGLSAYGQLPADGHDNMGTRPQWRPLWQFEKAIVVDAGGTHHVSPIFQFTASGSFHDQLIEWFGPARVSPRPEHTLDRQIAASAQWAVEEAMLDICRAARSRIKATRLCLAGGVALNCVANGRVLREGLFDEVFIQPASSDDGTALGNALFGWMLLAGEPPISKGWSAYLGRQYGIGEIVAALNKFKDHVIVRRPENLVSEIAESIASGLIVGIFREGSEFGPRALGHRSILCDPRSVKMRDHLNNTVKHREPFRPFAPLVLGDCASEYFDLGTKPSPYMLLAAKVLRAAEIPAVTHIDGSARIQTVNDQQEAFLCALLRAFKARTGIPVILNTSFNVAGEPIVESPEDALRCFLGTGIDVLYLEGFRVTRTPSS